MSTISRDAILQRIRSVVSKVPPIEAPPAPEVWPRQTSAPAELVKRFESEFKAVHGELLRCSSIQEAQKQLADLVRQADWSSIGVMDRQLSREATEQLDAQAVQLTKPNWRPSDMAELCASVVEAEVLLADTGSCLIACPRAEDRLLCYLAPACVVVARVDQLVEHLPAAWDKVAPLCASQDLTGEFVIVTGPSRTSDIEKRLILGVHGPKRLVVVLVG